MVKIGLFFILALALSPFFLRAQTPDIVAMEYFIDSDPGYGKGAPISLVSPDSLVNVTFKIPTNNLQSGFHTLFLRARDQNGNWGLAEARPFYLSEPGAAETSPIAAAEYFVDGDPGYGSGKALTMTPGETVNISGKIATTALPVGFHTLFVRARDQNGNWGLAEARPFYLSAPNVAAASPIAAAEYFVDGDPGYGSGKAFTITPGETVNISGKIATTALPVGFHTLFVRTRDQNGNWGLAEARPFYLSDPNVAATPPIAAAEYFVDGDPGYGSGKAFTVTPGETVNVSDKIETKTLPVGFHTLFVRTRNQNGNWGLAEARPFYLSDPNVATTSPIAAAEYFVDGDPGYGSAKALGVTPGETVNVSDKIETKTLPVGFHTLFVRTRNQNGNWGLAEARPFYLSEPSAAATSLIAAAEYFVDSDPGYGSGNVLGVTPGETINVSDKIATTALPAGFHTLYVRTRNQSGAWGLAEARPFYLSTVDNTAISPLSKLEYFYNADPGFGNGIPLSIPTVENLDQGFKLPITGLPFGKHVFAIRTQNTAGTWSLTASDTFKIVDNPPPAAPQNLRAAAGDKRVNLAWSPQREADFLRYRIYRRTNQIPLALIDSTTSRNDTTKTIAGLTNGITYFFQITAVDTLRQESPFSNEASAIPNLLPVVANVIRDVILTKGKPPFKRNLNANPKVFTDADGDTLTYEASSNAPKAATVTIIDSTLTVTPAASGNATITVTARDGKGGMKATSFKVTVNEPPTVASAIPDTTLTKDRPPFTRNLNNPPKVFSDVENDPLSFAASSSDTSVARSLLAGSTLTVMPLTTGNAMIMVTAIDGRGGEKIDTFTVAVNLPPRVVSTIADTILTVGVAKFKRALKTLPVLFKDDDNDSLSYSASSSAAGIATVTVLGDTLTVTPKAGGIATITVTADDRKGGKTATTFKVTVNQPPLVENALPDLPLILGGAPFTRNLNATPQVFKDPDNDPLAYSASSSNGQIAAASLSGAILTVTLKTGGEAVISITADDGRGGKIIATFKVTVNRPPMIANLLSDATLTLGGALFTRDLNAIPRVFNDPDNDSLRYVVSSSLPEKATARLSGSMLTVIAVASGSAVITVTAQDGKGGERAATFDVAINQPPQINKALADTTLNLENSLVRALNVPPRVFIDPDGDLLSYEVISGAPGKVGASVLGSSSLRVEAKSPGSATITLKARDGRGGIKSTSFRVEVNQPPIADSIALSKRTLSLAGLPQARNLNAVPKVFRDPDGDVLQYTPSSSAPNIATAGMSGTTLVVTPKSAGNANITIVADDGRGGKKSASFPVAVINDNRKPSVANAIPEQFLVASGAPFVRDLEASAKVFIDPDGHNLLYAASSNEPNIATAGITGSTLTVAPVAVGSAIIKIKANDNNGGRDSLDLKITVAAANNNKAPQVADVILDQTLVVGDTAFARDLKKAGAPIFSDPDGEALTYTAKSSAAEKALPEISGSMLTITPVSAGNATLTLTAGDNKGGIASISFNVTVLPENHVPIIINPIPDQTLSKGAPAFTRDLKIVFADPDDEPLTYRVDSSAPDSVAAKLSGSVLMIEPIGIATATITLTADDGKEGKKTFTFQSRVLAGNQPPVVANAIGNQTLKTLNTGGAPFIRDLNTSPEVFADANGDQLKYTALSTAENSISASIDGSVLAVVPGNNPEVALITIMADDNHGGIEFTTFTVTVVAQIVNQPPRVNNPIANINLNLGGASFTRNLEDVFSDQDDAVLTYTAVSSEPAIASAEINAPNLLSVVPLKPGTADITVTAFDGKGGSNQNKFKAAISGNRPPEIEVISPPPIHKKGLPLIIQVNVTDSTGVKNVLFHYREGGEATFTLGETENFQQGKTRGEAITSRGVEYFFTARDLSDLKNTSDTFHVQVKFDDKSGESKGAVQPAGAYRLISMPFELSNPDPRAVFDELGPYNKKKWRFFALNAQQQDIELASGEIKAIKSGEAYWLIVKEEEREIFSGPGKSNSTQKPFPIALHPQWNYIGNPFNFEIPLANLRRSSNKPPILRRYESYGNVVRWNKSDEIVIKIAPFEGYALFNDTGKADTLFVDPDLSTSANMAKAAVASAVETRWSIRISAQCQGAHDADNVAAVAAGASSSWDERDQPEPLVIGDYVSVFFPHADWGQHAYVYCADVRPEIKNGEVWEFAARSNIQDEIRLTFEGLSSVPEEYEVWLVDAASRASKNLRSAPAYSFASRHDEKAKLFQLIVGRRDFVEAELAARQAIPKTHELAQNFPNPFNPLTTIRFGLPSPAAKVTLKVFDMLGQEIVTLVDEEKFDAGYHTVLWDGRNQAGRRVASGVYIYRLQTGSTTLTKKMAMVK